MGRRHVAEMPSPKGQLAKEALLATAGVVALLAARPAACAKRSANAVLSGIVAECRTLRYSLPYEARAAGLDRAVDPFCDTLADGHWALVVIVLANVLCYFPSMRGWSAWGVSQANLSHRRLFSYQLAHASLPHLGGNMLTLLAVGTELSNALGCDNLLLLALYLSCGWAGGYAAATLSSAATIGASGAVSGVIVALSTLRPTSAVHILGDVEAANPLMLLLGTLAADLSRGRGVSWQAHLGGGLAGCALASLLMLLPGR